MSLPDNERDILAQLELSFSGESVHLAKIERNYRRRRVFAAAAGPIGLLAGLLLVLLGVGLGNAVGNALATAAYVLLVASGYLGVIGVRAIRAARRGSVEDS